ncbi:DUF397 domain-containing protein [Nocardia sp. NPDC006630]|uniref:DUF397 domain-containing protein n=1 Tax=Nocardia sp. NPDC006630 TaxID=3157181 RepID=UPI0033A90D01
MKKPVKGEWYKSSRSNSGNQCVEVFHGEDMTKVRDSKEHGLGPELEFPADDWAKFINSGVWNA